jgi:squalene-hopene/tetraprenyl-beta-curcumene cyclase
LERAVHFLDSAAVDWQKQRKCFTCHTNYAFLYARPAISAENETHRTVRQYAEELVRDRWPDKGPRWDAEVVATAAALAFNDAATTKKLHPVTKQALDKMWTLQRADGGWDWLKCDWPPMESDDHYGATLAAIAVGVAPEDYARTPAAQAGLAKLVEYLKANPAPTVHHQAMQLWASVYVEQLLGKDDREQKNEREKIVAKIWSLQRADGGWNLASLGDWQRGDKSPQDTESSDGYATGFLTYVLRMAGTPAGDERLRKAVTWLKSNQRESGRWFTRSLHADGKHFISHAGTAFAIMAIAAADSDPVGAPPLRSN